MHASTICMLPLTCDAVGEELWPLAQLISVAASGGSESRGASKKGRVEARVPQRPCIADAPSPRAARAKPPCDNGLDLHSLEDEVRIAGTKI